MIASPLQYVVDASVGVKLFVVEPLSTEAHALFAHLTANPPADFFVPDLFFVECTNIFWKYVRRMGLAASDAQNYVTQLTRLTLQATPTALIAGDGSALAITYNISAYDACYVALAQQLNVPLVTADEKLVRTLAGSGHDMRWLGALSIPLLPVI